MLTIDELIDTAFEYGIKIVDDKKGKYKNIVGIHLLNPSLPELENAIQNAINKGFDCIIIHA